MVRLCLRRFSAATQHIILNAAGDMALAVFMLLTRDGYVDVAAASHEARQRAPLPEARIERHFTRHAGDSTARYVVASCLIFTLRQKIFFTATAGTGCRYHYC